MNTQKERKPRRGLIDQLLRLALTICLRSRCGSLTLFCAASVREGGSDERVF